MSIMKKIRSAIVVALLLVTLLITNMHKTSPKFFNIEANMIISETNTICEKLKNKTTNTKECPAQTYEDYYDLPFEELNFIDEEVYEELKQIYAQIDFKSDFKKGDIDSYDFYIKKYKQLVNNEIMFYDERWDEDYYLDQYGQLKNREHSQYSLDKYTYFFFDIDGDSYPELGVTEYDPVTKMKRFIYVFKYEAIADRMIMWYSTESTYSWMMGSQRIGWNQYETSYGFIQLNTNGDIERRIEFVKESFFTNGRLIYLVTSPWYQEQYNNTFMSETMKSQGYYTKWEEKFYFRVTEEQFEELAQNFIQAEKDAKENIVEVSYTYAELFGDD